MNIFDKFKQNSLDVVIDIKPKLEGHRKETSDYYIYVPHLNEKVLVSVPNWIEVGQTIRVLNKGKTNKYGQSGNLLLRIIGVEWYDIEITTQVFLCGPQNGKSTVEVYVPQISQRVEIIVPNDTKQGEVLKIEGKGLKDKNGNNGNLYVRIDKVIRYDVDIYIKVNLKDLESEKPIKLIEVPHLRKKIEVSIPKDIRIGQLIRLKGLGIDGLHHNKGDLYLHIEDIIDEYNIKSGLGEGYDRLNSLIGLESIKQDVKAMVDFVKIQLIRKKRGLKSVPISLHCVFSGNPGTGKTTIARILADVYKEMGILSKGQLVEVDRSDLVSQYIGKTAINTQEKIKEALGGVLFIDEAYALIKEDSPRDFGQEAIDTLLKAMEDHRDEFIVIVAGYDDLMEKFINSNPGLKSRFSKVVHFPDYSADEMYQIFCLMCREYQYKLTSGAVNKIKQKIKLLEENKKANFANARTVRNLFEEVVRKQAVRLATNNLDDVMEITEEDII